MVEASSKADELITLAEAQEVCGVGYCKMREMSVEKRLFTVSRDGVSRGFRIRVRLDECLVYAARNKDYPAGGIESVKKFRAKLGRK